MRWCLIISVIPLLRVTAFMTTPGTLKSQRCIYQTAHKMYGAYCSDLNLQQIPSTLKSSIEILDISTNRIRELKNTTFLRYSNLKYLYMGDNMIQTIEALAFEPLTSLETLDLSLNAIGSIPEAVLNLPSLRKLYMQDNHLTHLSQDLLKMGKPFAAPLRFIHLSNCKLTEFPDFGIMPSLLHMNVSENNFKTLEPANIAELCGLKVLDLTGSFTFSSNICLNKPLIDWFLNHDIQTVPELFSIFNPNGEDVKRCTRTSIDEDSINKHNECITHLKTKEKEKTAKQSWIIVGGCLGGFVILAVLFLCCMYRRQNRHSKGSFEKVSTEAAV